MVACANLQASDSENELTVTHMHYTAWPDHGLPQNAMSLISFIGRVRKEHPVSPGPAPASTLQCWGGSYWYLYPPGPCDAADEERGNSEYLLKGMRQRCSGHR